MIEKRRVLFWVDSFYPVIGGVEVIAAQYLRAFIKRDYEFAIVTRYEGDEEQELGEFEGMPVYRLNVRDALSDDNPYQMLKLRSIVTDLARDFQPNLLHIYHVGMGAMLFDGLRELPSLMTLHAHLPPENLEPETPMSALLKSINFIASCSKHVDEELLKLLPTFQGRSSAILNALAVPELQPTPISFVPPRLLAIGRLVQAKGFDTAINAFALLKPHFPELRMTIAGNGPAFNTLKRQIHLKGLSDSIDMVGWVAPEDVAALINEHTLTIMPSRNREPFGLVALETAQMARPIVASNIGGLPEVIKEGITGLLVPQNDAIAFADATSRLLTAPDFAREMGLNAREHAIANFKWAEHIDAYDELMERLISPPKAI